MNEVDRLQNAINVAVWHLENGEYYSALQILLRHYKESEESKAANDRPEDAI